MILDVLNAHYSLLEERNQCRELLETLRSKAQPGAQKLTGMPHTAAVRDRVGDLATEIADLETDMAQLEQRITESEKAVSDFIGTIDNANARMVFRLRFLRGLQWKEVADFIGNYQTGASVSSLCYRYIRTHGL